MPVCRIIPVSSWLQAVAPTARQLRIERVVLAGGMAIAAGPRRPAVTAPRTHNGACDRTLRRQSGHRNAPVAPALLVLMVVVAVAPLAAAGQAVDGAPSTAGRGASQVCCALALARCLNEQFSNACVCNLLATAATFRWDCLLPGPHTAACPRLSRRLQRREYAPGRVIAKLRSSAVGAAGASGPQLPGVELMVALGAAMRTAAAAAVGGAAAPHAAWRWRRQLAPPQQCIASPTTARCSPSWRSCGRCQVVLRPGLPIEAFHVS